MRKAGRRQPGSGQAPEGFRAKKKPVGDGLPHDRTVRLVAGAALTGLRFVDFQGAALKIGAVHCLDGLAGTFVIHLDKAETTGAAGGTVFDDVSRSDFAVLGEQGLQVGIGGRPGQISNIDVHRLNYNSEKKGKKNAEIPAGNSYQLVRTSVTIISHEMA
jgi:hypothetical protein